MIFARIAHQGHNWLARDAALLTCRPLLPHRAIGRTDRACGCQRGCGVAGRGPADARGTRIERQARCFALMQKSSSRSSVRGADTRAGQNSGSTNMRPARTAPPGRRSPRRNRADRRNGCGRDIRDIAPTPSRDRRTSSHRTRHCRAGSRWMLTREPSRMRSTIGKPGPGPALRPTDVSDHARAPPAWRSAPAILLRQKCF